MGLEAARHFSQLEATRVILAVHSLAKGQAAAKSIAETTGRSGVVEVWQLDLASYASVHALAKRANENLDRLDIVVGNASIYTWDFQLVEQDESTITVNVISTMLLGMLLLPKLRETSDRYEKKMVLTFTGSFVHFMTDFPERKSEHIFKDLAVKKKARMNDRYNVSKIIELLIVRELANQITKSRKPVRIVVSIINPGFVKTQIMREGGTLFQVYLKVIGMIMSRTAEEGGRTPVHAAEGGEETHGAYLSDCKVAT